MTTVTITVKPMDHIRKIVAWWDSMTPEEKGVYIACAGAACECAKKILFILADNARKQNLLEG